VINLSDIISPHFFAILVELNEVAWEALIVLGYPIQFLLGSGLLVRVAIASFQGRG